jgi:hypothetical protein
VRFDRPYWITPHAVTRYRERVGMDTASPEAIQDTIQAGLQYRDPYPPTAKRHVASNAVQKEYGGPRFVALIAPPNDSEAEGEWPSVVTVYKYEQFRQRVIRKKHAYERAVFGEVTP